MRLTETHARFWQERKSTPAWVLRMRAERKPNKGRFAHRGTSIDDCINDHVKAPFNYTEHHAGNLIALLKGKKGQELREYLARIAAKPGTPISPERRASYARKWLKKLGGVPSSQPSALPSSGQPSSGQ